MVRRERTGGSDSIKQESHESIRMLLNESETSKRLDNDSSCGLKRSIRAARSINTILRSSFFVGINQLLNRLPFFFGRILNHIHGAASLPNVLFRHSVCLALWNLVFFFDDDRFFRDATAAALSSRRRNSIGAAMDNDVVERNQLQRAGTLR